MASGFALLFVALLAWRPSASPGRKVAPSIAARTPSPLIGVWRVVRFCEDDAATGKLSDPYGLSPSGFFVYTAGGRLSIHVARTDAIHPFAHGDSDPTPAESRSLLDAYFGYFGTYTVTSESTVVHHVQGGTLPSYIGTDQQRMFRLRGDSLTIGAAPAGGGPPRTWPCRRLVRVE